MSSYDPYHILYIFADNLSEKLHIPPDQIRLVLSLLLSIPIGYIFRFIKNPLARDIIGMFLGLFFQYFVYAEGVFHSILQTIITYLLVVIFRRKSANIVFFESLGFLALHHIHRQIYDYGSWKMDISVMLMIFTCKFTSFAFCYEDGGKDDDKLSEDQVQRKIKDLPSFFEYSSFIFFFAGSVAGPTFGFNEYRDFIARKGNYSKIPHGIFETLKNILYSFVFITILVVFGPILPIDYCVKDEFFEKSFLYQFVYEIISLTIVRIKYYGAWSMAQSTMSSCGLSFDGWDEKNNEKWDRVKAADPSLELYPSPKDKVDKWNSSCQSWLKRYVYFRVYNEEEQKKDPKKIAIAQNLTYITSAIWHGFYPGYYIFFIHLGFITQISRHFYRLSVKYPNFPYYNTFVYKAIRFVIPLYAMSYFGISFPFLELNKTIYYFSRYYFIPNIILYGLVLFFMITRFDCPNKSSKKIK